MDEADEVLFRVTYNKLKMIPSLIIMGLPSTLIALFPIYLFQRGRYVVGLCFLMLIPLMLMRFLDPLLTQEIRFCKNYIEKRWSFFRPRRIPYSKARWSKPPFWIVVSTGLCTFHEVEENGKQLLRYPISYELLFLDPAIRNNLEKIIDNLMFKESERGYRFNKTHLTMEDVKWTMQES